MLNVFAEVRPAERRAVVATFLMLFGGMAAHALLETARDALFLARLPPVRLAWVYLGIAVASLAAYFTQQRLQPREGRRSLAAGLLVAAAWTFVLWLLTADRTPWVLFALYIWAGVFATLMATRFWLLASELFTTTQAKRLFALIGAGGVLGAILGSSLARVVTSVTDVRHLLLVATGVLVVTALGPPWWIPRFSQRLPAASARGVRPAQALQRAARAVAREAYLRRVAALLVVSAVAFTVVDYLFKSTAARQVEAENLGSFFATTYVALNALAFLAQVFLVTRLVRERGVGRVLSILPLLFILGSTGVLLGGGLVAGLALKGFDGALRHSLHRTATEVLFVPLTGELRARVKGLMDVLGQRGGQALASVAILALASRAHGDAWVAGLLVLLALGWLRLAAGLEPLYLALFRRNLDPLAVSSRIDHPELDLASLETLVASLNSTDDAEVIAALDLLAEQERVHVIPALILYHPSPAVVVRALELFTAAGRTDILGITERLLHHEDAAVRAATLRALAWLAPSAAVYERFANDPAPEVRTTALVGLISYGGQAAQRARDTMQHLARSGSAEERLGLARAVRTSPGAGYESVLVALAAAPEPEVRAATARAMKEVRSARFIPALLDMLPDRALASLAREALVAIGTDARAALDTALGSRMVPLAVRRQIPRVLADFAPQEVAPVLLRHLDDGALEGVVRYRILRALGRLRAAHPDLVLDARVLERQLSATLENLFALLHWRSTLDAGTRRNPERATEVQGLIRDLLEHKGRLAFERMFRWIGLLYPTEDVRTLYRAARSADRRLRSSSLELLEHALRSPLREAVRGLLDDAPAETVLRQAGPYYRFGPLSYEQVLQALLERGGVGMRCLVAYHVGELRLRALRPALVMLPSDLEGMVSLSVTRALERIEPPGGGDGASHRRRPTEEDA